MTDREIFRKNFSELLRVTKAKQVDIAKYAEVSYQTVSAWVTGRGYPRADAMERICKFFGIKQSDLTEDKDVVNKEDELLQFFRAMSDIGQDKTLERAYEMKRLYPKREKKTNEKK